MKADQPASANCGGLFNTVEAAETAIRGLLNAGFSVDQLGVICPERFRNQFREDVAIDGPPSQGAPMRVAEGATVGAVLGGVALAAVTVATGGAMLIPEAMVLIGGGALVGGIGNIIASDGYRRGIDEYFAYVQQNDKILVGVYLVGDDTKREAEAEAILRRAGATAVVPRDDPTVTPSAV